MTLVETKEESSETTFTDIDFVMISCGISAVFFVIHLSIFAMKSFPWASGGFLFSTPLPIATIFTISLGFYFEAAKEYHEIMRQIPEDHLSHTPLSYQI